MNIYLIGMMGSGKSTVGKTLSEKMHKPFIDLDSEIEKGTGKNISEIFDIDGEEQFRKMETKQLKQLKSTLNFMITKQSIFLGSIQIKIYI